MVRRKSVHRRNVALHKAALLVLASFLSLVSSGSVSAVFAQSESGTQSAIAFNSIVEEKSVVILDSSGLPIRTQQYSVQSVGNQEGTSYGSVVRSGDAQGGVLLQDNTLLPVRISEDHVTPVQSTSMPEAVHGTEAGTCQSGFHSDEEAEEYSALMAERIDTIAPRSLVASNGTYREVEVLAVASGDFIEGRSEQEAIDDILFATEGANVYYRELGLQLRLVAIQVHTPGSTDPYNFAAQNQNAISMLDRLRAQWLFRPNPQRDISVVFAGSSFNKIYGLAYPSASCIMPEFSYAFVSKGGATGPGAQASLASTFAHEVGHLVGMTHDSTITAIGPSVMWPLFSSFPAGFSKQSLNEFYVHESNGGASCFSPREYPTATSTSSVLPGVLKAFSLNEGEALQLQFVDPSASLSFLVLTGKPDAAVFDPSSGLFYFLPDSSTVAANERYRDYAMQISVFGSTQPPMQVSIRVFDVNNTPRIDFSVPQQTTVEVGSPLQVAISTSDLDAPADQSLLSIRNAAEIASYPGSPRLQNMGATATLSWTPSVAGQYRFSFSAQDSAGAVFVRDLFITVRLKNQAPILSLPSAVSIQGTNTSFVVSASDPEGAALGIQVSGMRPGVLIERSGNSWTVDYSNAMPGGKEQEQLSVMVTDGVMSSTATVAVALDGIASEQTMSWPGVAVENGSPVNSELFFYDGATGTWQQKACDGVLADTFQFGGLVGDMPMVFTENGIRYPAIFRLIDGRGVFYVRRKSEVSQYALGRAGDYPILADFDGDGISDFAVYRPKTGEWEIIFSLIPQQRLADMSVWAMHGVVPFANDVDGDGLADRILVVRDSQGKVFADVRLATGKQLLIGIADIGIPSSSEPLVADVDNDGRVDLVVRASDGSIHGVRSSNVTPFTEVAAAQDARLVHTACGFGQRGGLVTVSRTIFLPNSEYPYGFSDGDLPGELLEVYQLKQRGGAAAIPNTDVDGDLRSDLTVFRPRSEQGIATWFSRRSSQGDYMSPWVYASNAQPVAFPFEPKRGSSLVSFEEGRWNFFGIDYFEQSIQWGVAGDLPFAGDYNGDGFSDLVVFRPTDASWWITYGPEFTRGISVVFGAPGDRPVPADYDGDGSTDLAIYRPQLGQWVVRYADGGSETFAFGLADDIPVPGDYLGEGRAQIAVWRPSTGFWYLLRERREVIARQWGLPGDIPLALDQNGDGRAELSVWREEFGTWYSRQIFDGTDTVALSAYGLPGDLPVGALPSSSTEADNGVLLLND